jgi:hypothetical protein
MNYAATAPRLAPGETRARRVKAGRIAALIDNLQGTRIPKPAVLVTRVARRARDKVGEFKHATLTRKRRQEAPLTADFAFQ